MQRRKNVWCWLHSSWFWFFMICANLIFLLVFIKKVVASINLPILFFGNITAIFSYLAYKYAGEKFRLELFEKRWPIYKALVNFCSKVIQDGDLKTWDEDKDKISQAVTNAQESFRGMGLHQSRALFGEDINTLHQQLSESYSILASKAHDADELSKHIESIWNILNDLPDIFKPYMYFGNYKKNF